MKKILLSLCAAIIVVATLSFLSPIMVVHAEDDDITITHLDLGLSENDDTAEKAAQEKAAQEKAAQEKAAQEKAAQEKAAQEKAAQEAKAQNQDSNDVLDYNAGGVKKGGSLKKNEKPEEKGDDPVKPQEPSNPEPPVNPEPATPKKQFTPPRLSYNPPKTGDQIFWLLENVRKRDVYFVLAALLVISGIFIKKRS